MKTSTNKSTRIGYSLAMTTCLAVGGAAAFTYFSVPQPRDVMICGSVAVGGLLLWLISALGSSVTSLVREDVGHPLDCIVRPRYLGPVLMAAATLTFAYRTFNVQEKLVAYYRHARPVATASLPPLKLKAIIFNGEHSSAVLNGESVRAGDKLNGVLLTEITPDSVTVEFKGQRKLIALSK